MSYQFQKISVLIVEDNQPMLEVTKALLLTFGIGNVLTAQNGEVGFKRFCDSNPDIVIADWMMKPMDGIALTRHIRTDALSPNPYVPVILMTGFSEKRRVFQARDAGVTEFLVKPFNARDLYRRIAQLIERPRQFVRSEDFFGPDRRRQTPETYTGPRRRESDGPEHANIADQQKKAQAMLDDIRQNAGMAKGDRFDLAFVESKEYIEDESDET
jgi:two-component system, chemotaxis family, chemotaxis protein CheY